MSETSNRLTRTGYYSGAPAKGFCRIVDRMFLEHILGVLEKRKNGESKQALIMQLKMMIKQNKDIIKTKVENGKLTPLINCKE